jgi:hypothetical protein
MDLSVSFYGTAIYSYKLRLFVHSMYNILKIINRPIFGHIHIPCLTVRGDIKENYEICGMLCIFFGVPGLV